MSRSILLTSLIIFAFIETLAGVVRANEPLRAPADFDAIANVEERSAALFTEAAKVLQDPRCVNCHPVTRFPTQGDNLHAHVPLMPGGAHDHGVDGLPCSTCHSEQNVATFGQDIASVPGAPHWSLAPASMAWQGLTQAEICAQLKDPARNGGRCLAQVQTHVATDPLVAWGWQPGAGRTPAPGTQAGFGALIAAWIETGAHCPK